MPAAAPGAPFAAGPGAPVRPTWAGGPAPLRTDYAHWGRRVGASLIDSIPGLIASTVLLIGYVRFVITLVESSVNGGSFALPSGFVPWLVSFLVLYALAIAWSIYDRYLLQGRTGQSVGKRAMKIRLIRESDGAPIGALMAFARDLVHYLDGAAYVGYLWPLWDDKRQTFADKLLKTIVVDVSENTAFTIARPRASAGNH